MTVHQTELHVEAAFGLRGRVALVVGGYGAIGTSISQALANAGATLIVAGRSGAAANALATQLREEGWAAEGAALDACDVAAAREQVASIVQRHGSLDILVNCLGFNKEQKLLEVTEEAFDEVYSKTLRPAMFLSQAVAAQQVAGNRGGSHIHLLSVRSQLGFRGRGYSAFCAAKGGLAVLLRQQATELAPFGITVNGVAPGAVRTRKNDKALEDPETFRRAVADIPLGRLASPADVAGAVHFLASQQARFVTGQILYVDGGLTASA
ncbi:SDR family NAD(P)-dependent oxidoreductase [Mesorhizobium sp. NPDC059054]|uniref:SDR family NAD(P)-dependent oxidoreductase n=1 Tax=Mesorhizobium sp. NPDC059054 TaxID=3346711 RepID=UPI0036B0148B